MGLNYQLKMSYNPLFKCAKKQKNKDIFRIVDFGNILVLIEKGAVTEM